METHVGDTFKEHMQWRIVYTSVNELDPLWI